MQSKASTAICLIAAATLLLACSRRTSPPFLPISNPPAIFTQGPTPTYDPASISDGRLVCDSTLKEAIGEVQPGPVWDEMAIGVSTVDEIRESLLALGMVEETRTETNVGTFLGFRREVDRENVPYAWAQACFFDGVLGVLWVIPAQPFQRSLEEWVALYGEPDLAVCLDFSAGDVVASSNRDLWAEDGLLMVTSGSDTPHYVILFPSIPSEHLEANWIMRAVYYPYSRDYHASGMACPR